MSVLILKNVPNEGPGTIADFLEQDKIDYRIVDLFSEDIPLGEDCDTLVILGGPMSVNDADQYPFIKREIELVKDFIRSNRRVLGICLGAQIMAKSLGARVYSGPEKEIGWYDIEIDFSGGRDPLMESLARNPETFESMKKIKVFQWHGETFDIPAVCVRTATSALYPNQAFRCGGKAYAFQFHVEVNEDTVYDWLKDEPIDQSVLKRDTALFYAQYHQRAMHFYRYFFV